jgi:hypothetical protein
MSGYARLQTSTERLPPVRDAWRHPVWEGTLQIVIRNVADVAPSTDPVAGLAVVLGVACLFTLAAAVVIAVVMLRRRGQRRGP